MSLHSIIAEAKKRALGIYGQGIVVHPNVRMINRLRTLSLKFAGTYAVNQGGSGTGTYSDVEVIVISDDSVKLGSSSKGYMEFKKPVGMLFVGDASKAYVADVSNEIQVGCMDSEHTYYMKVDVEYDKDYNMYVMTVEATNNPVS